MVPQRGIRFADWGGGRAPIIRRLETNPHFREQLQTNNHSFPVSVCWPKPNLLITASRGICEATPREVLTLSPIRYRLRSSLQGRSAEESFWATPLVLLVYKCTILIIQKRLSDFLSGVHDEWAISLYWLIQFRSSQNQEFGSRS